jgi:hypothetical protein
MARMSYREGRFWQPDVTVATVVVRDGRLLCVEEHANGRGLVLNQPAGHPDRPLDAGIERALWLTPAELDAARDRHRSPLVWRVVADALGGRRQPLSVLQQVV